MNPISKPKNGKQKQSVPYKGKPKYHSKRFSGKKKQARISTIKAGADNRLKSVFRHIGIPELKPFIPDPFQTQAISALSSGDCLVTAPTGAGKTWIAEQAIQKMMKKGLRSWYATPLKALSNTIFSRFCKLFGESNVGILTGDRKENSDAPIMIGTTEILRNQLYDAMSRGEDLKADFVVLDEAHYLGDMDRGVVWEEIMIYLPLRTPLLLLSATIGNAQDISTWLSDIRNRTCHVVQEFNRPVPLHYLFFHPSGTLLPLVTESHHKQTKSKIYKKVLTYLDEKQPTFLAPARQLPPMSDIIKVLSKYNLLPAIFFLKSRADCDNSLELCNEEILLNDLERREKLNTRIHELIKHFPHLKRHRQLWHLEHLAVGSHHSGQLPIWKSVIETLMTEGLLDVVFATSTVAAGVNFPARSVIMMNSDRFNGTEFLELTPTEFHQMTGRAGRRGMDNIGFAITIPGKFMDLRLIANLIHLPPLDVLSQLKINFTMVLNLLMSHTPDQIKSLLAKSFAAYMNSNSKKKRHESDINDDPSELWYEFERHMEFLIEERFVDNNAKLTVDGIWASRLRIDAPLLVAHGFRLGLFPQSSPALLAAMTACFVNERESNDDHIDKSRISQELYRSYVTLIHGLKPFAKKLISHGFQAPVLFLQPARLIYEWASDESWELVYSHSDISEGDLAKLILRTADHLRHFRNLNEVFPEIANSADSAIELILREPVISYFSG
ncbi:MAG: DEAD/DEAH box helicase [Desulfobacterales bacterium]|nr:DEAD/DEAH box helicase [Desulfobacterales bacterium]